MTDFSKKTQTNEYFASIMDELRSLKIKAIFSLSPASWNHHSGYRTYSTDTEIYIMLENGYCLIIRYRFIDALDVQFRKMTSSEEDKYNKNLQKDLFNIVNDICDFRTYEICRTETCNLEYGSIENISLRPVIREYSKWVNGDLKFVMPTEETFDQIKFTMNNGKSFIICADAADSDGYIMLWSEDTDENITYKR